MPLNLRHVFGQAGQYDRQGPRLHEPLHAVLVVGKVEHAAQGLAARLRMLAGMHQSFRLYLAPDQLRVERCQVGQRGSCFALHCR